MAYSAAGGSPELQLAKKLVNQVSRSIYDPPFVIIFDALQRKEVWKEMDLAAEVSLTPKEVQKYLAQMHAHRMIRKHVNKEKAPPRPGGGGGGGGGGSFYGQPRSLTVERSYWCLDYRDFYNVTKYRISAMRRTIDEKIKQELGKRGYICPSCGRTYDPLYVSSLFDPHVNAFVCEDCSTNLENNDNADTIQGSEDRMSRFNASTNKIRNLLRELDQVQVPTINVVAWVARNVESSVGVDLEMLAKMEKERAKENGLKVEITDQAEQERRKRQRERLAEEQRVQNALPVWYTHSTVTGKQTQLGLEDTRKKAIQEAKRRLAEGRDDAVEADEDDLDAHYAELLPVEAPLKEPETASVPDNTNGNGKRSRSRSDSLDPAEGQDEDVMVKVNGQDIPFSQVTEDHHDDMTPEEYEAYSELLFSRS